MSFGSGLVTVNSATATTPAIYRRRLQLQGSGPGPWANLGAPFWAYLAPSSSSVFTGDLGQSFVFGHSLEIGHICHRRNAKAYQLFKMLPVLPSSDQQGAKVIQGANASSTGNSVNGGPCSTGTQLAITQDDASEDSPLDFSSSGPFGQEVAADVETQEVRGIPDPESCEAPAPPEDVDPIDLSSQKGDPIGSDKEDGGADGGDAGGDSNCDPKPVEVQVEDLKAEIGDLREKLERSRDDWNKRVFQMEKYSMGETTALLKAVYWKGQLHQEYDDLSFRHLAVRMKSMLFWDEDFRGQGSLLSKFRENLKGTRDRDCNSIKRKWNRIIKEIAKKPHEFFQRHCFLHKVDDEEKIFLIKLAKACCVLKGIDISNQRPAAAASAPRPPRVFVPPPPPSVSSVGNPFVEDEDGFSNGWRDMPVFSASQWARSRPT